MSGSVQLAAKVVAETTAAPSLRHQLLELSKRPHNIGARCMPSSTRYRESIERKDATITMMYDTGGRNLPGGIPPPPIPAEPPYKRDELTHTPRGRDPMRALGEVRKRSIRIEAFLRTSFSG